MAPRYFEIIITGRQLAALLTGVVLLIFGAFGLGVAVRLLEPPAVHAVTAANPPVPTAVPGITAGEPAEAPTIEPTPTPMATVPPTVTPPPPPPPVPTPVATVPPPPLQTPIPLPPPTVAPSPHPEPSPVAATGGLWVQVAAVSRPDLADGVRQRVQALGFRSAQLRILTTPQGLFRVQLGPFPDLESAGRVVARLQESGFERPFVVRE